MKLIDAINFCYSNYPVVNIKIEMQGGKEGKYRKHIKNQVILTLFGIEEAEVTNFLIQTHCSYIVEGKRYYTAMNEPFVYIEYAEPKSSPF